MTRDEQIARLKAAREYWHDFQGNRSTWAHLHPPTLGKIDPFVKKPYFVPASFIPENVGGTINVVNRSQSRLSSLDSEPKEFIMSNFLPGGYKKRWDFKHWQAHWNLSEQTIRSANIGITFEFGKKIPLSEIYEKPTFSPLEIPTNETIIYFPETVYVTEIRNPGKFYWNDTNYFLTTDRALGTTHDIVRDPLSSPLFEMVFKPSDVNLEQHDKMVVFPEKTIIQSVRFIPHFKLIRCYYANCLHLFTREEPLTRVIRFYSDTDHKYALLGTEHLSQAVVFYIDLNPFIKNLQDMLEKDLVLENDLRFSFLKDLLQRSILFGNSNLHSLYDVDWVFEIILALDYWLKRDDPAKDIRSFFALERPEQRLILSQIIPPDADIRLRLAGYTPDSIDRILTLLDSTPLLFPPLIQKMYDEVEFKKYITSVLTNSLEKAIQIWSQRLFSAIGEGLTFWQAGPDNSGILKIYAYDSYQGGTGIANEFYNKIFIYLKGSGRDINDQVRKTVQCDVDIAGSVIHSILKKYDTNFLSGVFTIDDSTQHHVILNAIEEDETARQITLKERVREDIETFIKLDFKRLTQSEELIALYRELALGYSEIKETLKRTPTTNDLLLYASANRFYDPRAVQLFDYFRTMRKGDLTEICVRVSEIIPACTNACPECLDFGGYYERSIGQSSHVDKRLLMHILEDIS